MVKRVSNRRRAVSSINPVGIRRRANERLGAEPDRADGCDGPKPVTTPLGERVRVLEHCLELERVIFFL